MQTSEPAVVLLSGGLDSTTTLAIARADGFDLIALTFRYGQRHQIELDAAARVASAIGVREHLVVDIDLRVCGGSALTADIPVPKDRDLQTREIPSTYVPARNTIFLAYALALAEVRDARDIYIGVNAIDYSGYPDCRPDYIAAFEKMAALATRAGVEGRPVRLHTPLIRLTKVEIIRRGLALGLDYGLTRSCYDPDPRGLACGHCDSCRLRRAAFAQLGLNDPAPYADRC
jgi:7-cyano-7-deazaguanine synthase